MNKFIRDTIFLICMLTFSSHWAVSQSSQLWVGTYNSGQATDSGIYAFDFNADRIEAKIISVTQSSNPSFIAISKNGKFLYAVNENGDSASYGSVEAYAFDETTGGLRLLNRQSSQGKHPCHIQISPSGKWLAVSNYSSGSFVLYSIAETGEISEPLQLIQHFGMGKDPIRQNKSHVHSVLFSKNEAYVFVADLGLDEIVSYPFDASTGEVNQLEKQVRKTDPGSGPRHMAMHPSKPIIYAIAELNGQVLVMKINKGILRIQQTIQSLEKGYEGKIGSADIHVSPNGKWLYVSNRGDANSITAFKINSSGKLSRINEYSTGGIAPRNFSIHPSGKLLLVANQVTNEIVCFAINGKTGELSDTGKRIGVPKPVCLIWRNQ